MPKKGLKQRMSAKIISGLFIFDTFLKDSSGKFGSIKIGLVVLCLLFLVIKIKTRILHKINSLGKVRRNIK